MTPIETVQAITPLLTELRPLTAYGVVGSRDVDQARYRKALDEALALLAQMQASGAPSAVRMLTEDEIEAAWNEATRNYRARPVSTALSPAYSESWHEAIAIQRAFAAANNLTVKD